MNFCVRSVEEKKFGRKERKKKWMEGKWHNLDKCVEDVGLAVEGGEVKGSSRRSLPKESRKRKGRVEEG